jgi:hypothetical protein
LGISTILPCGRKVASTARIPRCPAPIRGLRSSPDLRFELDTCAHEWKLARFANSDNHASAGSIADARNLSSCHSVRCHSVRSVRLGSCLSTGVARFVKDYFRCIQYVRFDRCLGFARSREGDILSVHFYQAASTTPVQQVVSIGATGPTKAQS